jgi:hypothetical protein
LPNIVINSSAVTSLRLLFCIKHDRISSVSNVEKMTGRLRRYENSWLELKAVSVLREEGGMPRCDEFRELVQREPIEDSPVWD